MNKKLITKISVIGLAFIVAAVAIIICINNIGDPIISLGNNTALPGDTLEIPLEIDKNHGVLAAQVYINYDADNLKFESFSQGDVFDLCFVNVEEEGELSIVLEMNEDKETKKDGLIATLKFKAKVSADEGDYKLSFDKDTMFIDYDMEEIEIKNKKGKITVK